MFKFYSRHWYERRLVTKVDPNLIIYLPAAAFIICGWWWFVRASRDVWALTAPFYVALFVVWPYDPQTRYLMPLAPIWFIAVWWALRRCGWGKEWVLVVLLVAHFIFAEGYYFSDLKQAVAENRRWPADRELVSHITHDRESVAISAKIPADQRLMLQYLLDRRISTAPMVQTSFTWWILNRAQKSPPGYAVAWRGDDMILCCQRSLAQKIGTKMTQSIHLRAN